MIEIGDEIRGCRIVERLRSGGMATLFLARRSGAAGFERNVAIKVVHHHMADDPSFVEMFLDEARLSARVQHPNVVHVEELGEADGTYYLVMEYVDGCSLQQLLAASVRLERPLPPDLAVAIAVQVADGLHAAHETRGPAGEPLEIIHRDVSPHNVLLGYSGHVKLIDFGIAKSRGRAVQTEAGGIKGKLQYMAPEQAWGEDVDRRADVYALGVVLWEMLTGQRLFVGDNEIQLLESARNPRIAAPGTVVAGIPAAVDEAVMAALAPIAAGRPETARAFRQRLVEAMPAALALDNAQIAAAVLERVPRPGQQPGETVDADAANQARVHASRILVGDGDTGAGRGTFAATSRSHSGSRTRTRPAVLVGVTALVASGLTLGAFAIARHPHADAIVPVPRAVVAVTVTAPPGPPSQPAPQPPVAQTVAQPTVTVHSPDAPVAHHHAAPVRHHHHDRAAQRARAMNAAQHDPTVLHGAHGVPIVDDRYGR